MLRMNINKLAGEFSRKFWVIVGVSFIDRVGATMLFPFFSLYITGKFNVGMTQAGIVLGIFSLAGLFGQMIGGALTDKFGRRKLIIFSLVFSALSTLTLGLVHDFKVLIPLAIVIGVLSDIAGPAHNAMIADILPENQRQEGFGILRVAGNMAWIIGPTVGGFVAGKSFLALFIIDTVISILVSILFYLYVQETKPEVKLNQPQESILKTFLGYGKVLTNTAYMAFLIAAMLMGVVYQQMYNSLSVYLRDSHGIGTSGYGFLLTASAIVVILFQFSVTHLIKTKPAFKIMAAGTLFYMLGFSLFGIVNQYALFVLAIVVITIGEMLVVPTSQTIVTRFAPGEMLGRYMGVFGMTWALPATIGPGLAGLVLDNFNPNLLWYVGGTLCALSAAGFYALHLAIGKQERFTTAADEKTAIL